MAEREIRSESRLDPPVRSVNQRSTAPARLLATIALVAGFVILVAIVGGSLGGDSDGSDGSRPAGQVTRKADDGQRKVVNAYVVQNGDTLTSIARKTGVPLRQIEELNPGVDPQILVSGEKLKLR
jgi:nucleoid-associated protein YgaU